MSFIFKESSLNLNKGQVVTREGIFSGLRMISLFTSSLNSDLILVK